MARPRTYRFPDLAPGDEQIIAHGTKDKTTGEPVDQGTYIRRARLGLNNWRRTAIRKAPSKRAAKDVAAREFAIQRMSPAKIVIRRTA